MVTIELCREQTHDVIRYFVRAKEEDSEKPNFHAYECWSVTKHRDEEEAKKEAQGYYDSLLSKIKDGSYLLKTETLLKETI